MTYGILVYCICAYRLFTLQSSVYPPQALERHKITHTSEQPWLCDICHMRFKRKDNLTRHVKVTHSGQHTITASLKL